MKEIKRFEIWSRYQGSNWNFEHAVKYILQLDYNNLIEAGYFEHFYNKEKVKSVIELPSSLGCPMRCKFCASSSMPYIRKLSVEEEILIFNYIYRRELLSIQSPLVVSFMGIGDLFFTIDSVEKAILNIAKTHDDIQFTVSSCHWTEEMFKRIETIYSLVKFRALQITYISFNKSILYDVVKYYKMDLINSFSFQNTISCIGESIIPKFRINYLLLSGLNDSQKDFFTFLSLITPVKEKICVRISKLNMTKACLENKIFASTLRKMEELKDLLEKNGIQAYLFYAKEDDGFGCGQLLSETHSRYFEQTKSISTL